MKYVLLWARSTVYRCSDCNKFIERSPDFMGEPFDKGYQCECGCTSVNCKPGKKFTSEDKKWGEVKAAWSKYYKGIIEMIEALDMYDCVGTIPEMEE